MKYRVIALVAVAVVAMVLLRRPVSPPVLTAEASPSPTWSHRPAARGRAPAQAARAEALVYVVGAVQHPGLYRVAESARADDAVRMAGGLRADADPVGVNLAAYVRDGDEIVVPVPGDRIARAPRRRPGSARRPKSRPPDDAVDVNTVDAEGLAMVPGIGATIAARIVAVRERDGNFTTFDELLDVAGMTQTRLDRAQPYLRL